jgi:hypothetical protein
MDLHGLSGLTACLSKAGLAEGTNAATIAIAAPNGAGVDYAINGFAYHKADTDNIAMTALPAQAANTTCMYLIQINAAGTVSLKKGDEIPSADLGVNGSVQCPIPDNDNCPLGMLKIVTGNVTFTSGTTDLSAANITDTFYDLATFPSRAIGS